MPETERRISAPHFSVSFRVIFYHSMVCGKWPQKSFIRATAVKRFQFKTLFQEPLIVAEKVKYLCGEEDAAIPDRRAGGGSKVGQVSRVH